MKSKFRISKAFLPSPPRSIFTDTFWGDKLLVLPKNTQIRVLLDRAKRGTIIPASANAKGLSLVDKVWETEGAYSIIGLMECLLTVAETPYANTLSSTGYRHALNF